MKDRRDQSAAGPAATACVRLYANEVCFARGSACNREPRTNAEIARSLREIRALMEFAGEAVLQVHGVRARRGGGRERAAARRSGRRRRANELPGDRETIAGASRSSRNRNVRLPRRAARAIPADVCSKCSAFRGIGIENGAGCSSSSSGSARSPISSARSTPARWPALRDWARSRSRTCGAAMLACRRAGSAVRRSASRSRSRTRSSPICARSRPHARLTAAGSLRRGEPTVGDIDIVCTSDQPDAVIAPSARLARAPKRSSPKARPKASIWLDGGLQIDLRVLPGAPLRQSLAALHRQPRAQHPAARDGGSQEPARQRKRHRRISTTGDNSTCATEAEVYAALGLA